MHQEVDLSSDSRSIEFAISEILKMTKISKANSIKKTLTMTKFETTKGAVIKYLLDDGG